MLEIGEQPARRREHCAAEISEGVERRDLVQLLQSLTPAFAREVGGRAQGRLGGGRFPAFGRDDLARAQSGERGREAIGATFLQLHPPGGDVARRDADTAAHLANRRQPIGAARFEQRILG